MGVISNVTEGTVLEGSRVGETVGWAGIGLGSLTGACDGVLSILFKVQPEAEAMPIKAKHA